MTEWRIGNEIHLFSYVKCQHERSRYAIPPFLPQTSESSRRVSGKGRINFVSQYLKNALRAISCKRSSHEEEDARGSAFVCISRKWRTISHARRQLIMPLDRTWSRRNHKTHGKLNKQKQKLKLQTRETEVKDVLIVSSDPRLEFSK